MERRQVMTDERFTETGPTGKTKFGCLGDGSFFLLGDEMMQKTEFRHLDNKPQTYINAIYVSSGNYASLSNSLFVQRVKLIEFRYEKVK